MDYKVVIQRIMSAEVEVSASSEEEALIKAQTAFYLDTSAPSFNVVEYKFSKPEEIKHGIPEKYELHFDFKTFSGHWISDYLDNMGAGYLMEEAEKIQTDIFLSSLETRNIVITKLGEAI